MQTLSCLLFLLAILLARDSLAEDTKSQDQQHQHNQDEGKSTDEAAERIRRQIGGYFGAGIGVYGGRQFVPNGYPIYYQSPYGGGPYLGHSYGPYFPDRRFGGGGFGGGFYGR